MLEALYPRAHGISLEAANRRLTSVTDLDVLAHYDSAPELVPRSVGWADLEDSSAEDEERTGCTATRSGKGVHGPAPELRMLSAGASPASAEQGHADGRPDKALRVLGRREGLVSTAPSRDTSSAECLVDLRVVSIK